jgi:hypothetical protein
VGDTCTLDGNAANASSSASLDLALTAFAATQNAATESVAKAIQTATLKPTKGFTGTTLQFSFADRYATQLSGSGYVGKAVVCPFIAQLNFNLRQIFSSNGQGGGHYTNSSYLRNPALVSSSPLRRKLALLSAGDRAKQARLRRPTPQLRCPRTRRASTIRGVIARDVRGASAWTGVHIPLRPVLQLIQV